MYFQGLVQSGGCGLACVRPEWVEDAKKGHDATSGVPFLSTNDILTAHLCDKFDAAGATMVINFRERLEPATRNHAGNYESLAVFDERCKNPAEVRRLMMNPPDFSGGMIQMPGIMDMLAFRYPLITNWLSIQQDLCLPSCQQVVHLPIYKMRGRPWDIF